MFTNCISTHNNLDYLKLAIKSIKENSFYNEAPLFIYAEGCTDGTNEWLQSQEEFDISKYWIKEEKWDKDYWGIGGGMNFLAEKVETEYINFLHSDMYMTPNWDEPLFYHIQEEGRGHIFSSYRVEPKIFKYGQETKNGTIVVPKDAFGEYHDNFNREKFEKWVLKFQSQNDVTDIPIAQGVSFIIHKEDWQEIGGNDPRFAPASYEDVDLFIRMREHDFEFHTLTSSVVYHFGARGSHFPDDNFDDSSKRQKESEKKNRKLFRQKWGEDFTTDKHGMFTLRSML